MGSEIERIMRSCDKNVVYFYYVPRTFIGSTVHLRPIRMGDHVFFTNHRSPLMQPYNKRLKRAFDLAVSSVTCLFLVPLTLVVGIIIKIQSPGPVFFKQKRTGLNGKTFWCYKFRSMHVNKDSDSKQATENDPRKFPFGNFIRKYNIDELPQFFNVLIGNMSIVGRVPTCSPILRCTASSSTNTWSGISASPASLAGHRSPDAVVRQKSSGRWKSAYSATSGTWSTGTWDWT